MGELKLEAPLDLEKEYDFLTVSFSFLSTCQNSSPELEFFKHKDAHHQNWFSYEKYLEILKDIYELFIKKEVFCKDKKTYTY